MRAAISLFVLLLLSCQGPDAPDVAVCRDYIHRLCLPMVCSPVVTLFPNSTNCESSLQTVTGCSAEEFVFTSPTRARFLNCRLALLRAGDSVEAHPNCEDVAESFERCPDVVKMLKGIQ